MQCSRMHSYASMTFERVPCLVSRERIKVTSLISQIARHVPSCDTTSFFKIQGDAKIMKGKKKFESRIKIAASLRTVESFYRFFFLQSSRRWIILIFASFRVHRNFYTKKTWSSQATIHRRCIPLFFSVTMNFAVLLKPQPDSP